LIQELSAKKSDLYVIIDCCHSGGISRSQAKTRQVTNDPIEKRTWPGYIFHEAIKEEDLHNKALPDVIPEGNQVQLSACRNVELAWEHAGDDMKPGGLFSISLLKTLNSTGPNVSTYKIKNQISNFLRGWPENNKLQTPQLYVKSDDPSKRFKGFLGAELKVEPFSTQIVYNPIKGWIVGIGYIHGLSDDEGLPACKVFIGPDKTDGREIKLSEVLPTYAKLDPPTEWELNQDLAYTCELAINIDPIGIFIEAKEEIKKQVIEGLTAEMLDKGSEYLSFEEEEDWAKYSLRITDTEYNITHPFDQKPLILTSPTRGKINLKNLFVQLTHLAKWEFSKNSRNDHTKLDKGLAPELNGKPIQFSYFVSDSTGKKISLPASGDSINIELTKTDEYGEPYQEFGLTITNHSERELFCCLLYFGMDFSCAVDLLDTSGVHLGPGKSISVNEGGMIPVSLDNYIYKDNWPGSTEYIKVIACTSHFDLTPLAMDPLPIPYKTHRAGLKWKRHGSARQKDDWIAYETEVFIVNPKYEK